MVHQSTAKATVFCGKSGHTERKSTSTTNALVC